MCAKQQLKFLLPRKTGSLQPNQEEVQVERNHNNLCQTCFCINKSSMILSFNSFLLFFFGCTAKMSSVQAPCSYTKHGCNKKSQFDLFYSIPSESSSFWFKITLQNVINLVGRKKQWKQNNNVYLNKKSEENRSLVAFMTPRIYHTINLKT